MPRLLTVRKSIWVNKFKPDIVRGDVLQSNAAVEMRYYRDLHSLIERMTEETAKEIGKLFRTDHAEAFFAEDSSIASQARILTNALQRKFDLMFATSAQSIASRFIRQSSHASSTALHSSIQRLSGGLSLPTKSITGDLKDILTASIAENVALIKSIPARYLSGVQGAVMRSITSGNGLQDLIPYLAKNKGVTLRRARFISMDQTRKAFNAISRGRADNLGIKQGEWLHTGGSNHPRPTHIAMTGKIFNLTDGLYDSAVKRNVLPGEEPGCRCRWLPVIKFNGE